MQVELLNTRSEATVADLAAVVANYVDNFYNVERCDSYLGKMSPTESETLWASPYSIPQPEQPRLGTAGTDQLDSCSGKAPTGLGRSASTPTSGTPRSSPAW
ncbi:MAG: hypothetical protein JHC64_03445 [Mycolicibacterium sp.]|nr:hypothetical protein [Mycolicibacterium sp.]